MTAYGLGKQAKLFAVEQAEHASAKLVQSAGDSTETTIADSCKPTLLSESVNLQFTDSAGDTENASSKLLESAPDSTETMIESILEPIVLSEPVNRLTDNTNTACMDSTGELIKCTNESTTQDISVQRGLSAASSAAVLTLRNPMVVEVERHLRGLADAVDHFLNYHKDCLQWLWGLRAPLSLLGAIALAPKLVLLWISVVLAKPIIFWLYQRCSESWKVTFKLALPSGIRNSPFVHDLNQGADQGLPFILFWLYLCCAPFAVLWIAGHWIRGFFRYPVISSSGEVEAGFVFRQNAKRDSAKSENNFLYSRAFGLVLFAFFALGVPAFFSFSLYENLGIERMMRSSSLSGIVMDNPPAPPKVELPVTCLDIVSGPKAQAHMQSHSAERGLGFRGIPQLNAQNDMFKEQAKSSTQNASQIFVTTSIPHDPQPWRAPGSSDATIVTGYNGYWPWIRSLGVEPTKSSVFLVHFYLVSLASALCMLFFRAWFLFPLNFLSDEHDLQFTASGIKRSSLNGWFLSVITLNRWAIGGGPDSLNWKEIKCLRHMEDGFTKLCPLPETAFKKQSLSYKLLNKVAAFIDGLSNRLNTRNYLVFSTAEKEGDFGRNIKINLNDLNREQRARLFYSVRNWAPHVSIDKTAEEQMLGSTVLQDVRYTQLWFDLLTSRPRVKRQSALSQGETLKNEEYTVEERLSTGGQATAYLARRASGSMCVLKEFILATSSSTGALIESAREFEAEVSLLSQLSHPGIVHLEDFFTEDGRVYVALEYLQGQSLRQRVQKEGPLSEPLVAQITQSICEVLEYLHGFNPPIVHRDITPENIIMQPDDTIKLIDFSLAVKNDGRCTTNSCGKQAFTPPEQFREEVCVQSDIYALGATMYFLLTGLVPKPITSSSPRTKAAHVSPELNAIVEHATQLDLDQRYESVYWLKLDLASNNMKVDM